MAEKALQGSSECWICRLRIPVPYQEYISEPQMLAMMEL
jgi:hypothetical protein